MCTRTIAIIELSTCYLTTSQPVASSWRGTPVPQIDLCILRWRCLARRARVDDAAIGRLARSGLCSSHLSAQARLYLPPLRSGEDGLEARGNLDWQAPLADSKVLGHCRAVSKCGRLLLGVSRMPSRRGPGWRRCKCETMAGWDGPSVIPITHITELDEGIGRGTGTRKLVTGSAMSI